MEKEEMLSGEGKEEKKLDVKKEIRDWVVAIALALAAAVFLTQVIIVNAYVPSESMEPTVMTGDRVLGFRLSYAFSDPERLDIVIFRYPDDESQLFIKRVIGLPGDTVDIRDGLVYINGSNVPLEDEYVNGTPIGSYGPYEVPEGHYFMLGDNRNNSKDSREWDNTYVSEDQVVGKAIFRFWPDPGTLQ